MDGEIVLVAWIVVNFPVAGVTDPIGPGLCSTALTILVIPAPLTVPLAERVVNAPAFAAVPPIAGGDAQIVVLHVNPAPLVYCKMLDAVEQFGIAKAVGLALDTVTFASTVFAGMAAMPFTPTPPHAGAVDDPVETIACPLDDPLGLRSWTGTSVAPNVEIENAAASRKPKSRFMSFP
ncbi:hypothetical protein [Burkholderia vietnamiensis]|uniref:hypothetical protein n=1 Tax=Burkholderia vietnamiensis TaxID=60552 RepID=UPI00158ABB54|nr:hypothetical protein [Burkholderia vietnamiensis]